MTQYDTVATNLKEVHNNLKSDYDGLVTILTSIKGYFSGNTATKLENDLKTSLDELNTQFDYMTNLENLFPLLKTHKSYVDSLNKYTALKNNWTATDEEDVNPYSSEVTSWEKKVSDIENKIKGYIPSIKRVTTQITLVSPTLDTSYKNYIDGAKTDLSLVSANLSAFASTETYQNLVDLAVNDWQYGFKNNSYNLKTDYLANYGYTAAEIDELIEERSVGASSREKAVIAALTMIELGIDKNIKTKYCLSTKLPSGLYGINKPYTTETVITEGVDCASYVSWALNTSSDTTFNNSTLDNIRKQGSKVDYENLQAGDILYTDGHVAMVIANENGNVLWADASSYETGGYPDGMRLQNVSYKTLQKLNYSGYDMSDFYQKSA